MSVDGARPRTTWGHMAQPRDQHVRTTCWAFPQFKCIQEFKTLRHLPRTFKKFKISKPSDTYLKTKFNMLRFRRAPQIRSAARCEGCRPEAGAAPASHPHSPSDPSVSISRGSGEPRPTDVSEEGSRRLWSGWDAPSAQRAWTLAGSAVLLEQQCDTTGYVHANMLHARPFGHHTVGRVRRHPPSIQSRRKLRCWASGLATHGAHAPSTRPHPRSHTTDPSGEAVWNNGRGGGRAAWQMGPRKAEYLKMNNEYVVIFFVVKKITTFSSIIFFMENMPEISSKDFCSHDFASQIPREMLRKIV
jgi:hypothetical protein